VRRFVGRDEVRKRQGRTARSRRAGCAQQLLEMPVGEAGQADFRRHSADVVERKIIVGQASSKGESREAKGKNEKRKA